MKALLVLFFIVGLVLLFVQCNNNQVQNKKDLDENMIDLAMYCDNLGLYLRNQNTDYSLWLLEGMDSTLQILTVKFTEHRKLVRPFKQSYNKELAPPINELRKSLHSNNFPAAVEHYRLLINKCNDCHIDLEIDKTVVDWSKEGRIKRDDFVFQLSEYLFAAYIYNLCSFACFCSLSIQVIHHNHPFSSSSTSVS